MTLLKPSEIRFCTVSEQCFVSAAHSSLAKSNNGTEEESSRASICSDFKLTAYSRNVQKAIRNGIKSDEKKALVECMRSWDTNLKTNEKVEIE